MHEANDYIYELKYLKIINKINSIKINFNIK